MLGDFNTPLSSVDRLSRRIINKETLALNDMLEQMDLIDIYRTFHPEATKYTRINHILDFKTSLNFFFSNNYC